MSKPKYQIRSCAVEWLKLSWILLLMSALTSILFVSVSHAAETQTVAPSIDEQIEQAKKLGFKPEQKIQTRAVADNGFRFTVVEKVNVRGAYQIDVFLDEVRMFAPTTQRLILTGRSIDGDNRPDVWMMPGDSGLMEPIQYISTMEDSWLAARNLIASRINVSSRFLSWIITEKIGQSISIALARNDSVFTQIKNDQVDLYELEARILALENQNPDNPALPVLKKLVLGGWLDLNKRIHDERFRDLWRMAAVDVGLTLVGGKLISIGGRILGSATEKLAGPVLAEEAAAILSKITTNIESKVASSQSWLGKAFVGTKVTAQNIGGEVSLALLLTKLTAAEQVSFAIRYLQARVELAYLVGGAMTKLVISDAKTISTNAILTTAQTLKIFPQAAVAGAKQFKYIGLSLTTQVIAETLARPEDLFDPNPIIMSEKMLADRHFVQNVAYMANETFWMAGVSSYLYHRPLKNRLAFCGGIAITNSAAVSLFLEGNADPGRLALDTGWEVVIGSLQTNLDMFALRHFEALAERKQNPKLKLIGYAIALADQGLGYFAYAKTSAAYNQSKKSVAAGTLPTHSDHTDAQLPPESQVSDRPAAIKLVPILVEAE